MQTNKTSDFEIPGYRLIQFIDAGSFGQVFKAERCSDGEIIALKIVRLVTRHARNILREYRATKALRGIKQECLLPINQVLLLDKNQRILDESTIEGSRAEDLASSVGMIVYEMPLAEASLANLLDESTSGLRVPELLAHMERVALGLDALNLNAKIQHRDVKPENILLVDGKAMLADFGEAAANIRHAKTQTAGGAPAYMPPEVLKGKTYPRSDQYSFALTYFHLRTGETPSRLSALDATIDNLDLISVDKEREILKRATDEDPGRRFPRCMEMIRQLKDCLLGDGNQLSLQLSSGDSPIDGFVLIEEIGQGAFGTVWKAAKKTDGSHCALKWISHRRDALLLEYRAHQEFRSKNIRHTHLLSMGGIWLLDGQFCQQNVSRLEDELSPSSISHQSIAELLDEWHLVIEMELADGNLESRMNELVKSGETDGGIPTQELMAYMKQAAAAIDQLNKAGVIHRDIKPANLLLKDNQIKVADFGSSAVNQSMQSEAASISIGTPLYAPPEQWSKIKTTTSDQYSLACSFLHLHTGSEPKRSIVDVKYHLCGDNERTVIERATAIEPSDRYDTSEEFVRKLAKALHRDSKRPIPSWLKMTAAILVVCSLAFALGRSNVANWIVSLLLPDELREAVSNDNESDSLLKVAMENLASGDKEFASDRIPRAEDAWHLAVNAIDKFGQLTVPEPSSADSNAANLMKLRLAARLKDTPWELSELLRDGPSPYKNAIELITPGEESLAGDELSKFLQKLRKQIRFNREQVENTLDTESYEWVKLTRLEEQYKDSFDSMYGKLRNAISSVKTESVELAEVQQDINDNFDDLKITLEVFSPDERRDKQEGLSEQKKKFEEAKKRSIVRMQEQKFETDLAALEVDVLKVTVDRVRELRSRFKKFDSPGGKDSESSDTRWRTRLSILDDVAEFNSDSNETRFVPQSQLDDCVSLALDAGQRFSSAHFVLALHLLVSESPERDHAELLKYAADDLGLLLHLARWKAAIGSTGGKRTENGVDQYLNSIFEHQETSFSRKLQSKLDYKATVIKHLQERVEESFDLDDPFLVVDEREQDFNSLVELLVLAYAGWGEQIDKDPILYDAFLIASVRRQGTLSLEHCTIRNASKPAALMCQARSLREHWKVETDLSQREARRAEALKAFAKVVQGSTPADYELSNWVTCVYIPCFSKKGLYPFPDVEPCTSETKAIALMPEAVDSMIDHLIELAGEQELSDFLPEPSDFFAPFHLSESERQLYHLYRIKTVRFDDSSSREKQAMLLVNAVLPIDYREPEEGPAVAKNFRSIWGELERLLREEWDQLGLQHAVRGEVYAFRANESFELKEGYQEQQTKWKSSIEEFEAAIISGSEPHWRWQARKSDVHKRYAVTTLNDKKAMASESEKHVVEKEQKTQLRLARTSASNALEKATNSIEKCYCEMQLADSYEDLGRYVNQRLEIEPETALEKRAVDFNIAIKHNRNAKNYSKSEHTTDRILVAIARCEIQMKIVQLNLSVAKFEVTVYDEFQKGNPQRAWGAFAQGIRAMQNGLGQLKNSLEEDDTSNRLERNLRDDPQLRLTFSVELVPISDRVSNLKNRLEDRLKISAPAETRRASKDFQQKLETLLRRLDIVQFRNAYPPLTLR